MLSRHLRRGFALITIFLVVLVEPSPHVSSLEGPGAENRNFSLLKYTPSILSDLSLSSNFDSLDSEMQGLRYFATHATRYRQSLRDVQDIHPLGGRRSRAGSIRSDQIQFLFRSSIFTKLQTQLYPDITF